MKDLYDFPETYDERWGDAAENAYRNHYAKILKDAGITDILDCSAGTGNLTFGLHDLGYDITLSDISESMLKKAQEKASLRGINCVFVQCDFRELSKYFDKKFSCVMSTGNAFAHVNNTDVCKTLAEMDKLVQPGRYLYFDSRNWDKEMQSKVRFHHFARPFIKPDGERVNYVQFWDYNGDASIDIHILHGYERDGVIIREEAYTEHLYPFSIQIVLDQLKKLGYETPVIKSCPYFGEQEFMDIGWYCLLAKKH